MSWDRSIKTIKCACGKGTIEQEIREDDWNRTEVGVPVIKCPECKKKYNLISISHTSYKPGRGSWTNYYLVPKNIKLKAKKISTGDYDNRYQILKSDFPYYLILSYKKDWLVDALNELEDKTSVASLSGYAGGIAHSKKKHLGTAKIKDLREDVLEALNRYDQYDLRYEEVEKIENLNSKADRDYENRVEELGILLDL